MFLLSRIVGQRGQQYKLADTASREAKERKAKQSRDLNLASYCIATAKVIACQHGLIASTVPKCV